MDEHNLRLKAQAILNKRYLPGLEQEEIRSSLTTLSRTLLELSTHQSIDDLLMQVEDVYDSSTRLLLSPRLQNPVVQNGLKEVQLRLQDILLAHNEVTHQTGAYILPAGKTAATLSVSVQSFSHIPFTYVQGSHEELGMLQEELTAKQVRGELAKSYRIHPSTSEELWNVELIHAPEVWEHTRGRGIEVGIVDTGCDYKHSEISKRFGEVKGYNFVEDNDDPFDDNGHGTHVGGTVAGRSVGIAPESTLYALKFLDGGGYGSEVGFIKAAEWAIDHNLDVLNGSFGSGNSSDAEKAICNALLTHGIFFCAAAGNKGSSSYSYPASYDTVVSVAAVTKGKARAPFSQYNNQVNIAAPGVGIRSCLPGEAYGELSGTSMATPHVAGSAALIRSLKDDAEFVREVLEQGAEKLGDREEFGSGLVRPDQSYALLDFVRRWAA